MPVSSDRSGGRARPRPPLVLVLIVAALVAVTLIPLGYVVATTISTGWEAASALIFRPRVGELLVNTVSLVVVTIPICVAYEVDGVRVDDMPMTQTDIHHAKPIYEEMPGWWEDISQCRTFEELPKTAQNYVLRLEELSGARISCIGVGPGRDETIVRHDVLA